MAVSATTTGAKKGSKAAIASTTSDAIGGAQEEMRAKDYAKSGLGSGQHAIATKRHGTAN